MKISAPRPRDDRGGRRPGDDAVVERPPPRRLEVAGHPGLPGRAHELVARLLRLVGEGREEFVGGLAAVERRDQRLHDRRGAVERERVAPGFQEVRLGDVPLTLFGGLVVLEREMHPPDDLRQSRPETDVGGRVEDRVSPQDQERSDLAGREVGDERAEGVEPDLGSRFDRLGIEDRSTRVPERPVQGVRERVDGGRLVIAGEDEAPPPVTTEVGRDGPRETIGRERTARFGASGQSPQPNRRCHGVGERFDFGSLHRPSVVRARSGRRHRALDDVQAVHLRARSAFAPPLSELPGEARLRRPASEEVGVE